jgi:hypothetical protein
MEKGTVKMPSNFVTYVIVKLSKLDEIQNSTTVERMKSIVYIGETSQSPQERLSEHRRAKFAHNPLDYGMVCNNQY